MQPEIQRCLWFLLGSLCIGGYWNMQDVVREFILGKRILIGKFEFVAIVNFKTYYFQITADGSVKYSGKILLTYCQVLTRTDSNIPFFQKLLLIKDWDPDLNWFLSIPTIQRWKISRHNFCDPWWNRVTNIFKFWIKLATILNLWNEISFLCQKHQLKLKLLIDSMNWGCMWNLKHLSFIRGHPP